MSALAYRAPGTVAGLGAWDEWVAEVGAPALDAAGRALRALAALLVWPGVLAWRAVRAARWESGETLVSAVVLGLPAVALARWFPRVVWPSVEQAAADLQRVVVVLAVAWLVLYLRAGTDGGRACTCAGHRAFAPSGVDRKTWRWTVAIHEAGHLIVGKKLGRRTGKARIFAGGGGLTQVWPDHSDIVGEIAIDMAGAIAEGSWAGASGDRANAHWRLRKFVEPKRRGGVMSAGTGKARSMVATHRGEIERAATRIFERGWTT